MMMMTASINLPMIVILISTQDDLSTDGLSIYSFFSSLSLFSFIPTESLTERGLTTRFN